jgi:hypothetical protein
MPGILLAASGKAAAAAAFSPSDISGLNLWLKADGVLYTDSARTTLVTADGDPIGSASDSSGNNYHYSQATSGSRPTYKTSIVNGQPVFRFDGSADYFDGPDHVSALTSGTFFCVVKLDADPPAYLQTGGFRYGSGGQCHFPYEDGNIYEGFGSNNRPNIGDPTTSLSSAFCVYGVTSATNDWVIYLNNSSIYSTGTNTVAWSDAPFVGGSANPGNSTPSFYLDGDIAEIVIYNSVISSGDRTSLHSYFTTKYGTP